MKVKLMDAKPKFIMTMNLKSFRNELKKDLDLKTCVINNLEIIDTTADLDLKELSELVFLRIDWGRVITLMKNTDKEMVIKGYLVMIEGLTVYKPEEARVSQKEFTFKDENEERDDYLVTHSQIPLMEHHMERLIGDGIVDYSMDEWTIVLDLMEKK